MHMHIRTFTTTRDAAQFEAALRQLLLPAESAAMYRTGSSRHCYCALVVSMLTIVM